MYETGPPVPEETDDLKVARFYALGDAGMHAWLGVTPGVPHPNPEELAQGARDTVDYLLSRPTGPWDAPGPDDRYEATLEETSLKRKTARLLVDEWAEAELRDDRTAANDIFDELTERAVRRAKLVKRRRAIVRDHDAAFTLNTLYDRKERIKVELAPEESPEPREKPPPPPAVEEGREEPEVEPEERPPPAPPPSVPPPIIPAQTIPPPEPLADTAFDLPPLQIEEELYKIWPNRRPRGEKPPNPLSRAWWATGGAFGAWLSHPEKGKRRQVLLTLGMYATAAGLVWLFGHPPNEQEHAAIAPPSHNGIAPPAFDQNFTDSLQPADYEGQNYEWGAVADDYSAAEATPRLLGMIDAARAQGAEVNTWGDTSSSHWGIADVTVYFDDATKKSYSDTPHKLALLQYLSKLNSLEDDNDTPG